jgi:thiol-disulfide isomerase/thioredoxin
MMRRMFERPDPQEQTFWLAARGPMIRKVLLGVGTLTMVLAVVGSTLYVWNRTPIVAGISQAEAASPTRPFVIKIHAQWCPVCMSTKSVWTQIESAYVSRVNLVVFDFTNQQTSDASRAEARRLGLTAVFEENEGWTGTILIVDGGTKETVAAIHGSRDFEEYQSSIEKILRDAPTN